MNYLNNPQFDHAQTPRVGVLLTNLGTPDAPEPRSLRKYLKQFLSDPRVVELPRPLWWFILQVILLVRPKRSAAAYKKVWTEEGSPLLVHTRALASAINSSLSGQYGGKLTVEFAMRYGDPAISAKLQQLLEQGVTKLLVLPLYPQYGGPTTASTFDAVAANFTGRRSLPELRFVTHYHDFPAYIHALANKVRAHWQEHGRGGKLIFSYHGLPQSVFDKGDPYHCECYKTSRLVAEALDLNESEHITTFQSRFGAQEWLKPYTDEVLKALPAQGIKSVQILCPGFAVDCLETLEEIDQENREYFLAAGGEQYQYIPCLNSDAEHIEMMSSLITGHLAGWLHGDKNNAETAQLAIARGALR
jgi:protoporphyrin/coproporphyrin ferrochelatase